MNYDFGVLFKEYFSNPRSKKFSPMFSRGIVVLGFTFKFIILSKFMYYMAIGMCSNSSPFLVSIYPIALASPL